MLNQNPHISLYVKNQLVHSIYLRTRREQRLKEYFLIILFKEKIYRNKQIVISVTFKLTMIVRIWRNKKQLWPKPLEKERKFN